MNFSSLSELVDGISFINDSSVRKSGPIERDIQESRRKLFATMVASHILSEKGIDAQDVVHESVRDLQRSYYTTNGAATMSRVRQDFDVIKKRITDIIPNYKGVSEINSEEIDITRQRGTLITR